MTPDQYRARNFKLCRSVDTTSLGAELQDMLLEGVISKREFAAAFNMAKALRELVTSWNENYFQANNSDKKNEKSS